MSNHSSALVPIESWSYSSPELRDRGGSIDLGLLAEALIYYDHVYVNVTNPLQFSELLKWFVSAGELDTFFSLVSDGTITLYEYSFISTAIKKDDVYSLWNFQGQEELLPNTFEQRYLYHRAVQECIESSRKREKLYKTLRGRVIEAKAEAFGPAINNARQDYENPERNALVVQAFLDELYALREMGPAPRVSASIGRMPDDNRFNINFNIDFDEITNIAGPNLNFHLGSPLTAAAHCNRILWSAASLNCDMYLGRPLSKLVGDKLYESENRLTKTRTTMDLLENCVEFPDLRKLVNNNEIGIKDILKIRKVGKRFRDWLQSEADRDRDALIAYHHDVAREAGLVRFGRKSLSLFGVIAGGAVGSLIEAYVPGSYLGTIGGAAGATVGFVADVASRLGADWRPVVFGSWITERVREIGKRNSKP